MRPLLLAVASFLSVLAACSTPTLPDRNAPILEPYTAAEVKAEAKALMDALPIPPDEQTVLLGRLDSLLARPEVGGPGVTAVAVYRYGSGGFILRGGHGKVLASFHGGGRAVPYSAGGVGLGFTIGGGSQQGIMLVSGLSKEAMFGGTYSSGGSTATVGSVGVASGVMTCDGRDHEVHFVATSVGLEATYAGGKVTIERQ